MMQLEEKNLGDGLFALMDYLLVWAKFQGSANWFSWHPEINQSKAAWR